MDSLLVLQIDLQVEPKMSAISKMPQFADGFTDFATNKTGERLTFPFGVKIALF